MSSRLYENSPLHLYITDRSNLLIRIWMTIFCRRLNYLIVSGGAHPVVEIEQKSDIIIPVGEGALILYVPLFLQRAQRGDVW